MIVAFLALLELIRQGMVKVRQERHLGDVWIYRTG
jgi:chromatin segregation and condensation protein Rec8/ScpA/Scc1 (kleisin family)